MHELARVGFACWGSLIWVCLFIQVAHAQNAAAPQWSSANFSELSVRMLISEYPPYLNCIDLTPEQKGVIEAAFKAHPKVRQPLPNGGTVEHRPPESILAIEREFDRILTPEQKVTVKRDLLASASLNLAHVFATEPAIAHELALTDRQKLQLKQLAESAAKQLIDVHRKNPQKGKLPVNQAAITKQRMAVNDSSRKKIDGLLTAEQLAIVKKWRGE
jgi:hypothetical protein